MTSLRTRAVAQAPVLGTWVLGMLVFFRAQWRSGFRDLTGNGGDPAFIVYLLEHWFQVMHGQASWANPGFFYPVKGVLGLSDGVILFEVVYAPLRWLGLGELLAAEVMIIILSLVGFVTFVALMRRIFDPPLLIALGGGLVFTFSNGLWMEAGHYQLLAIWFLPGIALLAVEAWTTPSRRRSMVFAGLSGALVGLLFFTSFYIAWFCVPLGIVAVLAALLLRPHAFRRAVLADGRRLWAALLVAGAAFVVAMLPFADIYLPIKAKVPSPPYSLVINGYGHSYRGIFDVGEGNTIWSSILRHLNATFVSDQGSAVTPILLVGSLILATVVYVRARRRTGAISPPQVVPAVLAAVALAAVVLPVTYHGHSFWFLTWDTPGGSAIRAIWRIGLIGSAAATASLVGSISELWAARVPGRSYVRPALLLVMALVVVEQVNTQSNFLFNRPMINRFLSSVPKPPPSCHSFYMTYTTTSPVYPFAFQMDAMLVAQRIGLPTIDGYGYTPRGWALDVLGPALDANARQWAAQYHLSGVCRLDISDMTWSALG